jgi:hypothetical protein
MMFSEDAAWLSGPLHDSPGFDAQQAQENPTAENMKFKWEDKE